MKKETFALCIAVMWMMTLALGVFASLEDVSHPVPLSDFSARQRY